jgi:apolipoprotein N-acyltransferase
MRRNIGRLSMAFGAGSALPLAFAPYNYPALGLLCLTVLFWLWDGARAKSAAVTGFVFGLGMFGFGVSWVQISVHQFGLPIYSFSVAVTAAFILALCCYPAICGYAVAKLPGSNRFLRILCLFPMGWVLTEILRGWLFTGFPWLLVGYSQVDAPLAVFAPIIGAYGVSYITALLAAAAVVCLRARGGWRYGALGLVGFIAVTAITLNDVSWTQEAGEEMSVALVQGAIPQAVKWSPAYRQPTIDLYTELSKPHWGKSLIVWPETAIPAFAGEIPDTLSVLAAKALESGTSLLVGMPTEDPTGGNEYFNSVVQFGTKSGRYNKHHLVPFGEYLPFDKWVRPLTTFLRIPMSDFSSGNFEQPLMLVGGYAIGVSICYEDAYADVVARALPQANVLVNVSNDAWFGDSIAPHQHLQIARMRALETERYLLRATNTGISAIVDDRGKVVVASKQFVSDVVSADITPRSGLTPAAKYGRTSIIVLNLLLFAIYILPSWGRNKSSTPSH